MGRLLVLINTIGSVTSAPPLSPPIGRVEATPIPAQVPLVGWCRGVVGVVDPSLSTGVGGDGNVVDCGGVGPGGGS